MRKTLRATAVLMAMTFASACQGDSTGTPDLDVTGVYVLKTINGQPLSTGMTDGAHRIAADFTLRADETFNTTYTTRVTSGSISTVSTMQNNGTYEVDGSTVVFTINDSLVPHHPNNPPKMTATVSGATLTVGAEVYERVP